MVTKEWEKDRSDDTGIFFILAAEIFQVLDSIAWVRCGSGIVLLLGMCASSGREVWFAVRWDLCIKPQVTSNKFYFFIFQGPL